ncbi:MAG: hypothetical protein AB7V27_20115 [Candidatus Binatia bacterium]
MTTAGLLAIMSLSEWFAVTVLADLQVIDSYRFSAEPMVGYGGWQYSSATAYSAYNLAEGLCALAALVSFLIAVRGRSARLIVAGYSLLAIPVANLAAYAWRVLS